MGSQYRTTAADSESIGRADERMQAEKAVHVTNPHLARLPRGEMLIEWVEGHTRFGICRESESAASWYLVCDNGTDDFGKLPPDWINWEAVRRALCAGGDVAQQIYPPQECARVRVAASAEGGMG